MLLRITKISGDVGGDEWMWGVLCHRDSQGHGHGIVWVMALGHSPCQPSLPEFSWSSVFTLFYVEGYWYIYRVLFYGHGHSKYLGLGVGLSLLPMVIFEYRRLQDPLFSLNYMQEWMDVCVEYSVIVVLMVLDIV